MVGDTLDVLGIASPQIKLIVLLCLVLLWVYRMFHVNQCNIFKSIGVVSGRCTCQISREIPRSLKINQRGQTFDRVTPHHRLNKMLAVFIDLIQRRVRVAKTVCPVCLYCPVHVCAVDPNSMISWQEHTMTWRPDRNTITLWVMARTHFLHYWSFARRFSSQWPVLQISSLLLAWTNF